MVCTQDGIVNIVINQQSQFRESTGWRGQYQLSATPSIYNNSAMEYSTEILRVRPTSAWCVCVHFKCWCAFQV